MKTTYLGTIFKDEWVAVFSVSFDCNNGVRQSGTAEFFVSLPSLGLNGSEKYELTDFERAMASDQIANELKESLKTIFTT